MAEVSVFAGELAPGELAGLFRKLYSQLASGRLELTAPDGVRRFWLDAGQVRAVETSVEEEMLGQWLLARGAMDREQLALLLLRQGDGQLFGDLLLAENLVSPEGLHEHLVDRAAAVLGKLLFAPVGYTFYQGEKGDPRVCVLEVTTGDLLLAAVRRFAPLEPLRCQLELSRYVAVQGDTLLREQKVHLSPEEGFLLSRVDGRTTAVQLRRLVPLTEEAFYRALAGLVMSGILELLEEPPQQPARLVLGQEQAEASGEEDMVFEPHQAAEHQRVLKLAQEIERQNYYRRLGLAPGAGQDQIHTRFRELARMYHPDRASEPHLRTLRGELARIYNAVKEAHETLSHPERRARYDQFLKKAEGDEADFAQEERRRQAQREIARANCAQAELLIKAGDYGAALPLLEQAVLFDPQPQTLLTLARLELRNPMWGQRALSHLRMAVSLDPQLTPAWLELARFWLHRRQVQRALACVEKILEYDPVNEEARALRRQLA
jgi:tetratricopeptide (TPR) repeat protein